MISQEFEQEARLGDLRGWYSLAHGEGKVIQRSGFPQLSIRSTSLIMTLGFFLMTAAWGLASPPGSAGDDGFHTNSIVCANGSNEYCEIIGTDLAGNPIQVKVQDKIGRPCIFFNSRESGACIAGQEGIVTESTTINIDHVSGFFYSVMNRFLGDDYESSIRAMRTFNAFLFSALLFLALISVAPRMRRGIALMTMTAMIPIAVFNISSINPSSWAITGVLFSWVFIYELISRIGQPLQIYRTVTFMAGTAVSLILVFGARKDSVLYVFVGIIATLVLCWPKFKPSAKWLLVIISVAAGGLAYALQGGRSSGITGSAYSTFFSPREFVVNIVEIPSVVAGIIGSSIPAIKISPVMYYGLEMPFSVILITLSTFSGLVFTLLPGIRKRALAAVAFVIVMMIAIQMYPITVEGFYGSSGASPRIMLPLFLVAVVMFFTLVRIKRNFPSRAQGIWIFIAMPVAGAIAMLTTIRRYTNGFKESWLELFFEPDWWWEDFPLDPTAVWFLGVLGSLIVAYAAIRILREPVSGATVMRSDHNPVLEDKPVSLNRDSLEPLPVRGDSGTRNRMVFILSFVFSLISAWSLLRLPDEFNPAANLFRGYFPNDQLSYAGIAASAKAGNFGLVEPFTQTGVSFYPSWWYKIIGQFADWTGLEIPAAWSFLGLIVILGSVAFIGIAAFRVTGRAWAPLVIGILLWIGPLSAVLFDNWFVDLDSHAVLWGPYGALYALNAEAVGLSVGSAALALGYWTLKRPEWSQRRRVVLLGLSGIGIGITANLQTYSFLTLTTVMFWSLAVAGLLRAKSRKLLVLTISLFVVTLIVGSLSREAIGALPVFALMLIAALPGLWCFAQRRVLLIAAGLFFFALGAAPQFLSMLSGTFARDPFLTFRVDQSGDLGVPLWAFVLLGSPILVTWAVILWVQVKRKGNSEIALLVGWFLAFVLLSFNGSWGFGQEPYRFWINSVIVFVVVATLTLPVGLIPALRTNIRLQILAAVAAVLVGASLWNVGGFREYVGQQGNIDFSSPRFTALAELISAEPLASGLLTAEPCLDPRDLKVVTGAPIAFYNLGLAWPENKNEIDALIEANNAGLLDVELMRAAGVSYLITDTGCPTQWYPAGNLGVAQASSVEYATDQGTQRLELWRII
jgi:hypothetical protein